MNERLKVALDFLAINDVMSQVAALAPLIVKSVAIPQNRPGRGRRKMDRQNGRIGIRVRF